MGGPEPSDLGWLAALTGCEGISLIGASFAPGGADIRIHRDLADLRERTGDSRSLIVTDDEATFRDLMRAGAGDPLICIGRRQPRERDGATRFHYVNNPDGTVRWLFRAHTGDATYLELYNPNSLKGRLYKIGARLLTRGGLEGRVVSGGFSAGFTDADLVDRWLGHRHDFKNIAVFSGTRGLDRKVVIALGRGGAVTHFLKVPLSENTGAMLRNELSVLDRVGGGLGPGVVVPRAVPGRGGALLVENIRPRRPRSGLDLSERHEGFLRAMCARFVRTVVLGETSLYRELAARVSSLSQLALPGSPGFRRQATLIRETATELIARLPVACRIPVSLGHGDFTPWNMFVGRRSLHVYDWELACEAPLLSDLFHFVCQTGVLVRREPPRRVLCRLGRALARPSIAAMVQQYDINIDLHLRLYLLDKATYYLERFVSQTDLHVQAEWLLEFWIHALQAAPAASSGKLENA
jgi:hypothetical protein